MRVALLSISSCVLLVVGCSAEPSTSTASNATPAPPSTTEAGTSVVDGDSGDARPRVVGDAGGPDSAVACNPKRSHGTPVCDHCLATKCCAPIGACEADTECDTLEVCLIECFDHDDQRGCYNRCMATHPDAKQLWAAVEDCWFGIRAINDTTPTCINECSWTP